MLNWGDCLKLTYMDFPLPLPLSLSVIWSKLFLSYRELKSRKCSFLLFLVKQRNCFYFLFELVYFFLFCFVFVFVLCFISYRHWPDAQWGCVCSGGMYLSPVYWCLCSEQETLLSNWLYLFFCRCCYCNYYFNFFLHKKVFCTVSESLLYLALFQEFSFSFSSVSHCF